jgi:uncharacterized protein with HEPN domain
LARQPAGFRRRFREAHANTPWQKIVRMRHILVHDYFGIDLEIVWDAVMKDVPTLQQQVATILASMPQVE